MMQLSDYLNSHKRIIEQALLKFLPQGHPKILYDAMRYSVFSDGKRLRPILVIAGAEACGGKAQDVIETACAIELIHTYSLIHDDLPALDNDDYRRGKLTCHKKFSEDIAILAGDALLTYAFELVGKNIAKVKSSDGGQIIQEIAKAIGKDGMVGGQVLDVKCSNKWTSGQVVKWSDLNKAKELIDEIHLNKTAKLIELSAKIGALLIGATKHKIIALQNYGRNIGLAFQIVDDILDFKEGNSDTKNNRLTYPAIFGLEKSKKLSRMCIDKAKSSLKIFKNAEILCALADFVVERKY